MSKDKDKIYSEAIDAVLMPFKEIADLIKSFKEELYSNFRNFIADRNEDEILQIIEEDDSLKENEKRSFMINYKNKNLDDKQIAHLVSQIINKSYENNEMTLEEIKELTGISSFEKPVDKQTSVLTQKILNHISEQIQSAVEEKKSDITDQEILEIYLDHMEKITLIAMNFIQNEIRQFDPSSYNQNSLVISQDYVNKPDLFLKLLSKPGNIVFDFDKDDFEEDKVFTVINETVKTGNKETEVTTQLQLQRKNDPKELQEYLSISLDGDQNQIRGVPLDAMDKRVHSAVITLIDNYMRLNPQENYNQNCEIVITINDIHRAMGYKKNPTQNQRKNIIRSMYKLGDNFIWMNNFEEYLARSVDLEKAQELFGSGVLFSGNRARRLINADYVEFISPKHAKQNNENLVDGFVVIQIPPLLVHGKLTRQISSIPANYLELKGIRESDQIKALKFEIAHRIMRAHYFKESGSKKYNDSNFNTLVFDDLFREVGITINNKTARYKYIQTVEKLLEAFKTQKSLIKEYEINYKNKIRYSVKFFI